MPQYSNLKSYNGTERLYHVHQGDIMTMVHMLQRLHVILFVNFSESCHTSVQCLNVMRRLFGDHLENVFILKDLASPANVELFHAFGGKKVPMFYSLKTKRQSFRYDNPQRLIEELSLPAEGYEAPVEKDMTVKDLDIHLYVMNGCGYCTKMKKMLTESGVIGDITVISDIRNRPELANVRGFPYMISKKTGKTHTGFVPTVDKLVQALSV